MPPQLRTARKLLSDAQLIAFLRAVAAEAHVLAPRIILGRDPQAPVDLDAHFANLDPSLSARSGLSVELKVVRLAPRTYRITFGMHGGNVGDGGIWRVVFTAKGGVQRLETEEFWIQ